MFALLFFRKFSGKSLSHLVQSDSTVKHDLHSLPFGFHSDCFSWSQFQNGGSFFLSIHFRVKWPILIIGCFQIFDPVISSQVRWTLQTPGPQSHPLWELLLPLLVLASPAPESREKTTGPSCCSILVFPLMLPTVFQYLT